MSEETYEKIIYPEIVNDLLKYLVSVKPTDKEYSILDLILEYSIKTNMELELLGDAISTDDRVKNLIAKELENTNYTTQKKENNDW